MLPLSHMGRLQQPCAEDEEIWVWNLSISHAQATPTPGFRGGPEPAPDADDGGYAELVHNVCAAEDIGRDKDNSMPHCRGPAFRLDHLQKTTGGTIKACGLDAMPPSAVYFILNGGSFGNSATTMPSGRLSWTTTTRPWPRIKTLFTWHWRRNRCKSDGCTREAVSI